MILYSLSTSNKIIHKLQIKKPPKQTKNPMDLQKLNRFQFLKIWKKYKNKYLQIFKLKEKSLSIKSMYHS